MRSPILDTRTSNSAERQISSSRLINFLSAQSLELLATFYLLLLLYTGFLPFSVSAALAPAHHPQFLGLAIRPENLRDPLCNVALYVPLGTLLQLCLRRRNLLLPVRTGLTVLTGALVSLTVEFAQQLIRYRDPSWVDVASNVAGAALGAALSPTLRHYLRRPRANALQMLHLRPCLVASQALAAILLLYAALPPRVPLTLRHIYRTAKQTNLQPFSRFDQLRLAEHRAWTEANPSAALRARHARFELWADLFAEGVLYLVLAALLATAMRREYAFRALASAAISVWSCLLVASACAVARLLTASHPLDATFVLFQVGFSITGASVFALLGRRRWPTLASRNSSRLWLLLLATYLAYIAIRALIPFNFYHPSTSAAFPTNTVAWLPLHASLQSPLPLAMSELIATALRFATLSFLLCLVSGNLAARRLGSTIILTVSVSAALALALELLQLLLPTRTTDLTTPLVAGLAAALAAIGCRWLADLRHAASSGLLAKSRMYHRTQPSFQARGPASAHSPAPIAHST
jgi:glycopeptide antibiotics resistance protein